MSCFSLLGLATTLGIRELFIFLLKGLKKKNVAREPGDLNNLIHFLYHIYSTTSLFRASFFNCVDEKQKQYDLPYHLPVSFSIHVGG